MKEYYTVAVKHTQAVGMEAPVYSCSTRLQVGQIVDVTYRGKKTHGLVLSSVKKPDFDTKDCEPTDFFLPEDLISLLIWQAHYYQLNENALVRQIVPAGLGKKRRKVAAKKNHKLQELPKLTTAQKQAVTKLGDAGQAILHGDTGSGKTRVYQERTQNVLNQNRSVLILVPEIGLSTQLADEFKKSFKNVLILHSRLTEARRDTAWKKLMQADEPMVVVGARSALFAPIKNLGLIVIDEFHDSSFTQDTWPQYDSVLGASVRAKAANAQLILGSATPDISTYARFEDRNYPTVRMQGLAVGSKAEAATIQRIDMSEHGNHHGSSQWLSSALLSALKQSMKANQQSLIFLNRRGSAPLLQCEACGWQQICSSCDLPTTLHADISRSICHTCNTNQRIPSSCPDCKRPDVISRGVGTKQIENDLQSLFPAARIARFDGDNLEAEQLHNHLDSLRDGSIDILVGTQIITKGLDLPNLSLVGVVHAEGGLNLPDFMATERNYQTIHQVIGRVGRHTKNNTVILQSYDPDSALLKDVSAHDWQNFYKRELAERKKSGYPPDRFLMLIQAKYKSAQHAEERLNAVASKLTKQMPELEILGPAPAFRERIGRDYRWQLLVKSKKRSDLIKIARALEGSVLTFTLDPSSLL